MKNWSNKELDGTIFLIGIIGVFILTVIFTYKKPEFAGLPTTEKILEIIKDMLIFMAGYLFKKAADLVSDIKNGSSDKQKGTS